MNITTQVISIVAAIAVLAVIGGWLILRQRDKSANIRSSRKTLGKPPLFTRQAVRRKEKLAQKTSRTGPSKPPEWKEHQPDSVPENDRIVSLPDLKDSSSQEAKVVTITPPGKNGRSKH